MFCCRIQKVDVVICPVICCKNRGRRLSCLPMDCLLRTSRPICVRIDKPFKLLLPFQSPKSPLRKSSSGVKPVIRFSAKTLNRRSLDFCVFRSYGSQHVAAGQLTGSRRVMKQ